jgi:tripartite-type tricarboxylate transporter receptor subunit TctC
MSGDFPMLRAALAMLMIATTLSSAVAQPMDANAAWPSKPVHLIAPFPPASTADVIGRALGQKLGARLGQPIVIDNRVGGSGSIGADATARAAPDGYTLGIITPSIATQNSNGTQKAADNPAKRFTPISMIARSPLVLVVYPGLPAQSVSELVALAKKRPGELNFSSAGPASLAHVAGALFANRAHIELTHVAYKSTAQSVVDLIGGRVQMQFATIAPSLASIRSGKLRALAVTSKTRVAALPDVPTMEEAGVRGFESTLWFALVGPAGLPTAIATRLNHETVQVLNSDEMKKTLAQQGFATSSGSAQAVTAQIDSDVATWKEISPASSATSK